MAITELFGDLTKCPIPLIAHQVNCQGVMGAGLARQIREKWPIVYEEYKNALMVQGHMDHPKSRCIGTVQFVDVPQHTVCNMFAQYDYGRDRRYTNYEAFDRCCRIIREYMIDKEEYAIAFPKYIGCGLAGGDWRVVRAIIESTLGDDMEVYIYEL